jgi:hypothetical protein
MVNGQEEDRWSQNQLFVLINKIIKFFQVEILWAKWYINIIQEIAGVEDIAAGVIQR